MDQQKKTNFRQIPPQPHYTYPAVTSEDEISLVDLWLVLVKRKNLFLTVVLVVFVLGCGFSLKAWRLPNYAYSTVVEPAKYPQKTEDSFSYIFVEPLEQVIAKLKQIIIPSIVSKSGGLLGVSVTHSQGTNMIVLKSRGAMDDSNIHRQLHRSIFDALRESQKDLLEPIVRESKVDLEQKKIELEQLENPKLYKLELDKQSSHILQAQNTLTTLKDDYRALLESKKLISGREKFLGKQINELQKLSNDAASNRLQVLQRPNDETHAMTLMLIDNEIQRIRYRLADYEKELFFGLKNEKSELENKLVKNVRSQEMQSKQVELLQQELDKLKIIREKEIKLKQGAIKVSEEFHKKIRITPAFKIAQRSLKPVGLKPLLILALSLVLGGMLGACAVFVGAFIAKVREVS